MQSYAYKPEIYTIKQNKQENIKLKLLYLILEMDTTRDARTLTL